MGRRGTGALLWHKVDTMVTNREVRLDAEEPSWDVVDEWLKHYQNAQRRKTASPTTGAALPDKKTNKKKLFKSKSKQQITHKSVPESFHPIVNPPYLQKRFDSKNSFNRDKVHQRCESPRAAWQQLPLPKPISTSKNNKNNDTGDLFMDREYMQQMQQRLLEQHEETLRRRIRQRQAEEAQRERQLMLAGLVPTPTSHTTVVHTPKRNVHSQPNSRASQHSSRLAYPRVPRPRTGRPRPVSSPRHRDRPPSQHKKTVNNEIEEHLPPTSPTPDDDNDDDDLDEAAETSPPPPPKLDTRPRLAILLQACRAVVGATQPNEIPLAPSAPIQLPEEEVGPGALRGIKYESPLLAKLREVENVEELYRLAELIVAHTKHP